MIAGDSIDRILWALDRTYRISVADTGNVQHSEAFTTVIAKAAGNSSAQRAGSKDGMVAGGRPAGMSPTGRSTRSSGKSSTSWSA